MRLIQDIVDRHAELVAWRRDFHRHPELSGREHRTAGKVAQRLRQFGCDEVVEGLGGPGLVGVLRCGPGPAVALRSDMDALAIEEDADHDYRSTNPGVMHACGHDGHMSMLLGAARYLAATRRFRGTVLFVFQHAEETVSGARQMIEAGLFERFPVDAVYGLHNVPGPAGVMMVTDGPIMAAVAGLTIRIAGKGGHAGIPQASRDPVPAAAAVVAGLQTIVARRIDPNQAVVLSLTGIRTDTHTHNVIPSSVEIKGTARFLDAQLEKRLPREIRTIVEGIAAAYGTSTTVDYQKRCPPTVNAPAQSAFARRVAIDMLGEAAVTTAPPTMAGEDFSLFLEQRPGNLAFLGNGIASAGIHHPRYDFNDDILPIGASYFVRLVEAAAEE